MAMTSAMAMTRSEEVDEQIWIEEQENKYKATLASGNDGIWAHGSYARFLAEMTGRKEEAVRMYETALLKARPQVRGMAQ